MRAAGIFVTATGTEVGKTIVSCGIARLLADAGRDLGVWKPFASGAVRRGGKWVSEDALLLKEAARTDDPLSQINPFCFRAPLAPDAAARLERRKISWKAALEAYERLRGLRGFLVVEGVGGLRVPIDEEHEVPDLIAATRLPVLVVASAKLGTLNHTMLTLEALERRGLPLFGVVLNRFDPKALADRTNLEFFRRKRVPVAACLPHDPSFARDFDRLACKLAPTQLGRWLLQKPYSI